MKKQTCLLFMTLSTITTFTSCGGGNSKLPQTFSPNAILAEERPLTTDELNIATRICYAYQSKSINFRTNDFLGKNFNFSEKKTDCQNTTINYTVPALLIYDDNNNLMFTPNPPLNGGFRFYGKVQTDTSGYLAQLCSKIKTNSLPISNTTTSNGVKVQISFTREDLDSYLLMYFNQQPDGTYKVDSAEKFKVRTQFNFTTGQILGMDEFYSAQKVCSSFDKAKNSDFQQSFTSR